MRVEVSKLYESVKNLHMLAYARLCELKSSLAVHFSTSPEEAADLAYAMRETSKLCDALRKEADKVGARAQQIACLLMIRMNRGDSIKTEYVTATPDLKMNASLPTKRDAHGDLTAEYLAITDYLKVPREAVENDVARVHWPAWGRLITSLVSKGEQLPPGIRIDDTVPEYCLRMRGRREPSSEGISSGALTDATETTTLLVGHFAPINTSLNYGEQQWVA